MMYDVYWYCQMKKNEWFWKSREKGEEETKSMPHAPVGPSGPGQHPVMENPY
jgi:hypothetical protein